MQTSTMTSVLFLFILFISTTSADVTPSNAYLPPESACSTTLDPAYCKTVTPPNENHTIYEYSRSSITQSLLSAKKFSALVQTYDRSSLSNPTIQALDDCQFLMELNMDFLERCGTTINSTQTLSDVQIEDLEAALSAILTNQQTCADGLYDIAMNSSTIKDGLYTPLSNGTKMFSVLLGFFNRGWVNKQTTGPSSQVGRKLLLSKMEVHFPFEMSYMHRTIFRSVSSRKLLQQIADTVLVCSMVTVDPNGGGNFTTINQAIDAAPNNTATVKGYSVIYIVAGVYSEYISIPTYKRNVMMIGDGINQTVITGNRSVVDGWTTFNSATLAVVGKGFVGAYISVRNTAGAIKHQAVALRSGADKSIYFRCSFEGYQDTLYPHSLRQYYRECDVYGTVDFIFGNAAVVLQNCNIYPRLPRKGQFNPITAQGRTDPNQNTGIIIHNCTVTAAPDLISSNFTVKSYLGRPWKAYSRTVYMQSFIDSLIDPSGWHDWIGDFALSTLYYAEYNNIGPGSDTTNRVTWPGYRVINATEARDFTVSKFVSGDHWIPEAGVPFSGGLL